MRTQPQLPAAADPLLPAPAPPAPPLPGGHRPAAERHDARCSSWLAAAGFSFFTFNSGMAVYRSRGDRATIGFVAFSYLDLLGLFLCLRWFEGAQRGSPLRDRLKVAVWLLTTALTLLFSAKVAAVMPVAAAVVVWLMAFATIAGGFYAFFCCNDKQ